MVATAGVDGVVSNPGVQAGAYAINPILGGALTAYGLGSSLFGKKRKTPSYDLQAMVDTIRNSQNKLQALNTPLKTGVGDLGDKAAEARRTSSQNFLTEIGKTTDLQGKELSDILRQRVMGAQPGQEAALRENLAATGGLNRGAAGAAFTNLATTNAQAIGQGEQELAVQALQNKAEAIKQVYQLDDNFINNRLGIDKDTLLQIYQSDRQDLINEANQLLGIQEFSGNQATASSLSSQTQNQNTLNALIGAGATIYGSRGK